MRHVVCLSMCMSQLLFLDVNGERKSKTRGDESHRDGKTVVVKVFLFGQYTTILTQLTSLNTERHLALYRGGNVDDGLGGEKDF